MEGSGDAGIYSYLPWEMPERGGIFCMNACKQKMKCKNNLQNQEIRDGERKDLRVDGGGGDRCPGAGFGRALRASLCTP